MVSAHLGPLIADAGRTWFVGRVWRDRWWRVGVLVPVARSGDEAAWCVGLAGGWRYRRIAGYDELRGPTGAVEVEWATRMPDAPAFVGFVRATVGVDVVVTPYAHVDGERIDPYPVVEITVGTRITPQVWR
jgi:hypothetical protein